MTEEKLKRFRLIYKIITGLLIIIAGICLISACIDIYRTGGKSPFSRQIVKDSFSKISIPIYMCIVVTILGFIVDFILPKENTNTKLNKNHKLILDILYSKKDLQNCDKELLTLIENQKKKRIRVLIINLIITAICGVAFFIYALDKSIYQADNTAFILNAVKVLVPLVIVALCSNIIYLYQFEKSLITEIDTLKLAPVKTGTSATDNKDTKTTVFERILPYVKYIILIASIILIIYGFSHDGDSGVLSKAIRICTECIGLG